MPAPKQSMPLRGRPSDYARSGATTAAPIRQTLRGPLPTGVVAPTRWDGLRIRLLAQRDDERARRGIGCHKPDPERAGTEREPTAEEVAEHAARLERLRAARREKLAAATGAELGDVTLTPREMDVIFGEGGRQRDRGLENDRQRARRKAARRAG